MMKSRRAQRSRRFFPTFQKQMLGKLSPVPQYQNKSKEVTSGSLNGFRQQVTTKNLEKLSQGTRTVLKNPK